MKFRMVSACALAAVFAFTALAADITGKWTAEVPGRNGEKRTQTFNLKADGDKLTGTVVTQRGESPITDGKIQGDTLSFTQKMEFNGNTIEMKYSGKVVGNEIQFKRETQRGASEFVAKRATS